MDNTIYILGASSFIAKNFYIHLKRVFPNIILLEYSEVELLKNIKDNDVLVNFCGVNRANSKEDYIKANYLFLKKVITQLKEKPFFIHTSSLMVYGFEGKELENLSNYQKWFIESKLEGEKYLRETYPSDKLCIIRPSNIYGYSCTPYYNNLLSTLVYEKITGGKKINNLNKNCYRNMLAVHNFSNKLIELIKESNSGTYNIISNNNLTLESLVKKIYNNKLPEHININDGDFDNNDLNNKEINGESIIVEENITEEIVKLEKDMKTFISLKENVEVKTLSRLSQPRGDMVEISSLNAKRLYKITFTKHAVRGNHYHYKQIEEFYNNKGKITYLLAHKENIDVIYILHTEENQLLQIKPDIIHTLSNDFIDNIPEIIISSTQEFIPNEIPDTKYINILS